MDMFFSIHLKGKEELKMLNFIQAAKTIMRPNYRLD